MKARLPDGYGKGNGGMNSMIRQAQKMQEDMAELQEKLNEREYSITAGGGLIELTMTGAKELKSVKLNPDAVDKDNVEDLEDIIVAGVNAVINKVAEDYESSMEKLTGGMSMPGMPGLF
ncbi:MAG: YbaB/EbfC family nucleoid-associated protein [Oscillospiraceae bacterium]|jgi:DNA-binding YbaB/EbfC family protein|nr:YbaB/EbfC family nucleoid-associated protein [Oscillospiraceae bacterium]